MSAFSFPLQRIPRNSTVSFNKVNGRNAGCPTLVIPGGPHLPAVGKCGGINFRDEAGASRSRGCMGLLALEGDVATELKGAMLWMREYQGGPSLRVSHSTALSAHI